MTSVVQVFTGLILRGVGHRPLMLFGDTLVLDRWRWLAPRLPPTPCTILDAGCGNGWLSIACAKRGHETVGLGWDDEHMTRATSRAAILGAHARFEVQDLRELSHRADLVDRFNVVVCTETIEHILDDERLMIALAGTLRRQGRLLLTTPNAAYVPMGYGDEGPFETVETGGHVRKGYDADTLRQLCRQAGLEVDEVSFCSWSWSQRVTRLLRWLTGHVGYGAAWALTLPLRVLPLTLDRGHGPLPPYSICLVASKS